jgi:hypothetical protein
LFCAESTRADVKLRAYEAGILPPLIQLLTTRERMVLQNSIATIRNLSFHPEVKAALMEAGAMCGTIFIHDGLIFVLVSALFATARHFAFDVVQA